MKRLYKTADVFQELRRMTGMKITDGTCVLWKQFCNIKSCDHHINRDQFITLMQLAIYKLENGQVYHHTIDEADLYEIYVRHDLRQKIKQFDKRGVSRKSVAQLLGRRHKISESWAAKKIYKVYGGYKNKQYFSKKEIEQLDQILKQSSRFK